MDIEKLKSQWLVTLRDFYNHSYRILEVIPVGGGSINSSFLVETDRGNFFTKVNQAKKFPLMFETERMGLELLRKNSDFFIPEVIAIGETDKSAWILMVYIYSGEKSRNFWQNFGERLANMHRQSNSLFGLDHDNYIGSLPQKNEFKNNWVDFFIQNRIEPQLKLAVDNKLLGAVEMRSFNLLFEKLGNYFPEEKHSLLHGDLWSGNFATGSNGEACIFDPAVYYGHREMDLAMSKLFGGFDSEFYESYNRELPMENNWEERMDLYNLYPLLVHVNLFGSAYKQHVKNILNRFC